MTKNASSIIKENDPSAKIILFGGLNLYSGDDIHLQLDKNFASQLAAMNIAQYGSAISVHAYSWKGTDTPTQDVWDNYTQSLLYYQSLFLAKEIWLTETGQEFDSSNENLQAQYLLNSHQFFKGKVTHVFWYSLYDNSWELPQKFGLVNIDGTPRTAYNAMQTTAS